MGQVGAGPAEAGICWLLALTSGLLTGVDRRVTPPQPASMSSATARAPMRALGPPTARPSVAFTGASTPVTIPRIRPTMTLG